MKYLEGISLYRLLSSSSAAKPFWFKLFDHMLGPLAFPPRRAVTAFDPGGIRSILVMRPGGIGDALLVIPMLRFLRAGFPTALIDVVAEGRNYAVFGLIGGIIAHVILYDSPLFTRELLSRKQAYDLVIDTEQWHWFTAIAAAWLGRGTIVGFDTRPRRSRFYTHAVAYSAQGYEAENFLNLIRPLLPAGQIVFPGQGFLSIPNHEISMVSAEAGDNAVVLYLSSSIPQRSWPLDHWQELIHLLARKGRRVILVGGKSESALAQRLSTGYDAGTLLDRTATPLIRTAAYIAASKLFIGADSGILHLAYALGVPTISFFGPGIEGKWAPRGAGHVVLNKNVSCSPCTLFGYTPRCNHAVCMESITPEEVMQAVAA